MSENGGVSAVGDNRISYYSAIRRALAPWHRAWDLMEEEDDEPAPPAQEVLQRLARLVALHPTFEPGLREAVTVYLLLDFSLGATGLSRRIIELPGQTKARVVAEERSWHSS